MARQDGPGSFSEGNTSSGLDAFGGAGASISDITSGRSTVAGESISSSGSSDDGGGQNRTSGVVRDQQGNVRNPYPNSFFSKIFGADNVSYQNIIPQNTLNKLGGMAEQRFNNPQMAVRGGFGKLFGGAEGEMTTAGPRVGGTREQTLGEGIAGLALGSIVPGAGMLERAGRTVYAPEGMLPEGYEQDQGGLLESLLGGFGGAIQPEPGTVGRAAGQLKTTASELLDQARSGIRSLFPDAQADSMVDSVSRPAGSVPSLNPRQRDAMSQNMSQQVPTPAQEVQTMNLSAIKPSTQDRMMAAMLSGIDRASAAPSAPSGLGNPTATAKVYDLSDPGVLAGMEQAGGGYKVQDIQEQLDKGRTGTFDSRTGKVQLSVPGTAFGLSYDLSKELGLSSGVDIDSLLGSIQDALADQGTTSRRVTGSGNFQQGPAFLKGVGAQ